MRWKDVPLKSLPELMKLGAMELTDIVEIYDRDVSMISIITGKSEDYLSSIPKPELDKYRAKMFAMFENIPKALLITSFSHQGRKYTLNPNISQASVDQIASVHMLQITDENYYSQLPAVCALFAEEKIGLKLWKKKLSFSARLESFKTLPSDVGMGVSLFFCKVSEKLPTAIKTSLEEKLRKQQKEILKELSRIKRSGQNGDGSRLSTNSQTGTSRRKRVTSK